VKYLSYFLPSFLILSIFILNPSMSLGQATAEACKSSGGLPQYRTQSDGRKVYSSCIKTKTDIQGRTAAAGVVESLNEKCQRQLSAMGGGKGCYSVAGGRCSFGFDKCTSSSLCSNNGGNWQNGSCVDKNSVTQTAINSCSCQSATYDGDADVNYACSKMIDGQRVVKSKTASCDEFVSPSAANAKKDACKAAGGSFVDATGICECEAMNSSLVFDGKSYKKCEGATAQSRGAEQICADKKGTWDDDQKQCKCGDQAQDLSASAPSCRASSSNSEECSELASFEEKVDKCESESSSAVKSCDAESKNANSGYDDAKAAAAILGQVQMARGQQQGSVEACMRAGVMANTMFYGLDLMKNDCNPGMEQCKSSCSEAFSKSQDIVAKCTQEFDSKFGDRNLPQNTDRYVQFMTNVSTKVSNFQSKLNSAKEKCDVEAPSKAAELNRLMKDMNNSAVQAQKCQCQQTAGQANCNDIMGPEFCLKNPTDPRCPRTVAVCTPQSADYNTKTCLCMRDPKNSQCAVITGGAGGPAALAGGPGYNPIGTSGGNYSGKTGGSGGINLNGGLGDDAVAVSSDRSGGGPGEVFGVAGTGSAGGGSTPSGEDGSGAGAGEGEGQTKSGVAGLFNALKTGMGNLLGGGSGNKAGGSGKTFGDGSKNNGNAVDPNKWRPRGVAAVGQIGGRNENIFQKISDQYGMQSHTFMSGAK